MSLIVSKDRAEILGIGPRGEGPSETHGSLSFRARLLILISFIVVPSLGIAIYGNLEQRRIEKARVCERASAIATLAAAREENFIQDTRQLLATLTQFPFLLLSTNQAFSENHLTNLRKLSPDYANFGLIEIDGRLFCSAEATNNGVNLKDRSYFRRTVKTGKFSVGDFQRSRVTRETTLNFGYPVFNEAGKLQRVLYSSLKIAKLSEAIADIQVPWGGAISVMDQSGNVLAHHPKPEQWVGKSLAEVPAVKRILAGAGGDFEMAGPDKIRRFYAVTTITDGQSPSLFVSVEVPLTVLFAKANSVLIKNVVVLGIITVVIWFIVQVYAKRFFLRPLNTLAGAALRLAEGDLRARAGGIRGSAELVQLGRVLDKMADSVESRTVELVKANEALRREMAERQKAQQQIQEQEQEKKQLEAQFLRSQRMESIGALAGGIAHDLNNALVPVLLGSQMLREGTINEKDRNKFLDLILTSGRRCTEMVKQILSFARGARGQMGTVPMRQIVLEMAKIANDTFPKSITIESLAPADLWNIEGDATELHQVLMNLCVNARDAMPEGGKLTLTAENTSTSEEANLEVPPGSYILLKVTDSGMGIPRELQGKIFEPFFTTKGPDKGTGLGLSTVATLVKRHKGSIKLRSEAGKGTQFLIYLPAVPATKQAEGQAFEEMLPSGRGELILLADDEQMVLELAKHTLENFGYRVLTAANGLEAITCFELRKAEIEVVITDTDMPVLSGISALSAIRKIDPLIPIILASATKHDSAELNRKGLREVLVLSKPYGIDQLLKGVAHVLSKAVKE